MRESGVYIIFFKGIYYLKTGAEIIGGKGLRPESMRILN